MINGIGSDPCLLAVQEALGAPVSPIWLRTLWEFVSDDWSGHDESGTRHEDSRGGLSIDAKTTAPHPDMYVLRAEVHTLFPDMVDQRRDVSPHVITIVPGIDNPNALRHLVTALYRQCSDAGVEVRPHVPASLRPLLDYALECADQAGTTTSH